MKNKFFVFYLMLLPILGFSQFDYSFDLVTSVDKNKADYSSLGGTTNNVFRTNYRIGANFNFQVFKNTFIKTGLRYSEVGDKIVQSKSPSEGITFIGNYNAAGDFRYIESPLMARYEIIKGKWGFFIEGGISLHFILNYKVVRNFNLSSETILFERKDFDRRMHFAYAASLGVNYNLNSQYQLFVQPILRTIDAHTPLYNQVRTIRSLGLEFGVRLGFNFAKEKGEF